MESACCQQPSIHPTHSLASDAPRFDNRKQFLRSDFRKLGQREHAIAKSGGTGSVSHDKLPGDVEMSNRHGAGKESLHERVMMAKVPEPGTCIDEDD
jgi:hypothetical protein